MVIVLDFSAWDGPVYAVLTWAKVLLEDLADHAMRHTNGSWEAFYSGQNEPLRAAGVTATSGAVIKFEHLHRTPMWAPYLDACLDDAAFWEDEAGLLRSEDESGLWRILRSAIGKGSAA